jgi:glycosyltransferase involved in cell wall biosynthesis
MRIAIVTVSVGSHVRVYVEYLRQAGHEVTVLTNSPRYLDTDVPTVDLRPFHGHRYRLPLSLIGNLRRRRLWAALTAGRFDVVNCQMVMTDALDVAEISPAPFVLSFHGSDLYRRAELPGYIDDTRLTAALQKAAAIHAVSAHMAEELIALGAPAEKVSTFQYGIDPLSFLPAVVRDPNRIVSVRSLKPLYRVHLLIEAMPAVLKAYPQAVLEIYDEGPELQRLQDLASNLNLGSSVEFVGRQPIRRIAGAVGRAAVWASMAESDGTPLSLLEAMSAGAYPVLAELPTLHEWIEPPRGTFVAPTPEAVANGLIAGLARSATGAHIEENRAIVEERATRSVNLARFERILEEAASTDAPA